MNVFFIVRCEDKEDATYYLDSWLEDYRGREFYSNYEIVDWNIERVSDLLPDYFEKALRTVNDLIPQIKEEIAGHERRGKLELAGVGYARIGNILMQSFCEDMPYWNLPTGDWSPPDRDDWAVMVALD